MLAPKALVDIAQRAEPAIAPVNLMVEQMIEDGIIILPKENQISERVIPNWVKNNARWWSNDQISDDDFIKSIQYLVKKGIILV
mgnify:CR=1 FL=1